MAYGVKYRFQLESYNKTIYRVDLLEDGYSGTITTRPLGKAPVLRMQEADPFRSTSCDLVLECQSDGEYIDLYTTDPFHFKVEVYRIDDNDGAWIIWRGYVPTEIYSEPDIAPPYDVRITATDGIGLLKEYTFESVGAKSIRAHICDLLVKTGDSEPMFYYATRLCKLGSTEVAFMDDALINLDYLAGKNCYDVLKDILVSLRSVLIYRGSHWLIVREVDVQMSSEGMLTVVQCITSNPYYVPSSTTVKEGKSVGQMGVADMWPVGYLTRRVVPAKKGVRVRAPWHYVNGYPEVSANGWTVSDNASFDSTNKLYHIGTRSQSVATAKGAVQSSKTLQRFVDNFKVVIKANAHSVYGNDTAIAHYVRVNAAWRSTAGGSITTYYWDSEYGWTTNDSYSVEEIGVEGTNEGHDPNACSIVEVSFPPVPDNNPGYLTIKVDGSLVDIYGIEVLPATVAGYEDNILIDNGARGEAESIDVFGGRLMLSNFINLDFYQGIFFHTDGQSSGPDTQFSDLMNIGKDFMSLTALAYAREVAAPRIEITGKLNHEYDTVLGTPAPFIKSHGVWALMKSYDWDMMTEDVSFTAVTLPSVLLDVEDEIINSIAPEGVISGGSSSGSGGGGGGGGSYVLPIASASTLGGIKVGSGLSIDSNTGVLSATGGGGGGGIGSVGLSMPTPFSVENSPLTADGTINVTLKSTYTIPTTSEWNGVSGASHSHGNLELLDDITSQDVGNWDDAASKAHTHNNKAVLDGITSSKVSQWDSATGDDTIAVSIEGTNAAPTVKVALGSGSNDSEALPIASSSKSGLVSTGAQTFAGNKTFTRIYLGNSETYGMYIEWDDTNHMFKIVGDVYATGDVTAGG